MDTVLIVDDDTRLLKMLRRTLVYEGLNVTTAANGREALHKAYTDHPDIIVLDWMLPELDGLTVLEELRTWRNETPVLMLTARDEVADRVRGLEGGADDYLVKPFAPTELVARVRALLRRTRTEEPQTLSVDDLTLDPVSRRGRRGARTFALTPTEYELLKLFIRHPRQVLKRSQILLHVWGPDFAGEDNIIEVYVGYLRRKTEADGEPRMIHTVRGVGYVLQEAESCPSACA
jgi:two-component system response regulator MprA